MEFDLYVSVRFYGGLILFVWKIVLVVVSTTNKLIINFYLSVYLYICMYVYLSTHPPTYNPTYLHIYRYMCMRAYVHTHACTRTYVHTCIHTHTWMYKSCRPSEIVDTIKSIEHCISNVTTWMSNEGQAYL